MTPEEKIEKKTEVEKDEANMVSTGKATLGKQTHLFCMGLGLVF